MSVRVTACLIVIPSILCIIELAIFDPIIKNENYFIQMVVHAVEKTGSWL